MKRYTFKRFMRETVYIHAGDTLTLRKVCREKLGRRKSARYRYRQIGANSFLIENRLGIKVAEVWA